MNGSNRPASYAYCRLSCGQLVFGVDEGSQCGEKQFFTLENQHFFQKICMLWKVQTYWSCKVKALFHGLRVCTKITQQTRTLFMMNGRFYPAEGINKVHQLDLCLLCLHQICSLIMFLVLQLTRCSGWSRSVLLHCYLTLKMNSKQRHSSH